MPAGRGREAEVARLLRENERLRRENEELREALRFLPPRSFLATYSLLVEAVYLTRFPSPEARTHTLRRRGAQIPVRNYRAYRQLRRIDQRLYELGRAIRAHLNGEDEDAPPI